MKENYNNDLTHMYKISMSVLGQPKKNIGCNFKSKIGKEDWK